MKKRVLFVCTGNSARSLMAEAVLRQYASDQFDVFSAGTDPAGVDTRTLDTLKALDISAEGLSSKAVDEMSGQTFDYVITLCSKAGEDCQHWPGSGVVLAWDFPDPKQSSDSKAFLKVLHEIIERVRLFVSVNTKETNALQPVSPVQFYKCLADEVRLLSLLLIDQETELCVCELMEALQESQPKISRHLAQLRKAGLLLDRRQGQWVYYRLHPAMDDWMLSVLKQTRNNNISFMAESVKRLQQMANRPQSVCC